METSAGDREAALELWKAARGEHAAAQRRMWQTAIVLGPLSFAGLGILSIVQCPLPMDFLTLGGASMAVLMLWLYQAERCQAERDRATEDLRMAESALSMRPSSIEGATADRMVRGVLAVLFLVLWGWAWSVRPDCLADDSEESALTHLSASR